MLKPILLVLGGLSVPLLLVAHPSPTPPLCRVIATTTQDTIPGFYTVTVRLRPGCPQDAVANVRLESYVGGGHPSEPIWLRITYTEPLIRSGVPWYWRGSWESKSGLAYPFKLPNMKTPFPKDYP